MVGDESGWEVELLLLWVVMRVLVELVLDLDVVREKGGGRDRSLE